MTANSGFVRAAADQVSKPFIFLYYVTKISFQMMIVVTLSYRESITQCGSMVQEHLLSRKKRVQRSGIARARKCVSHFSVAKWIIIL